MVPDAVGSEFDHGVITLATASLTSWSITGPPTTSPPTRAAASPNRHSPRTRRAWTTSRCSAANPAATARSSPFGCGHHGHLGLQFAHGEAGRVDQHDRAGHRHRPPRCGVQQFRRPLRLVDGVAHVGLPLTVAHLSVAGDPHLLPRAVLGVQGEDPAGPDHHVIDVAAPITHRHRAEHRPPGPSAASRRLTSSSPSAPTYQERACSGSGDDPSSRASDDRGRAVAVVRRNCATTACPGRLVTSAPAVVGATTSGSVIAPPRWSWSGGVAHPHR